MGAVRRILLILSASLLVVTLLLVNALWTVNNSVANREVVKSWIDESGIYDNAVNEIVIFVNEEVVNDESGNGINIESAVLNRTINKVFTPEKLKEITEPILDGVYNWLEGNSPELTFKIDLKEEKKTLATTLADEAKNRLSNLPECTAEQLQNTNDVDVFAIACKPPQIEQHINEFYNLIVNNEEFLPETTFTSNDIKLEKDGVESTISQVYTSVPSWYGFARTVVWFVLIIGILWVTFVLFLSKSLRYGIKHVMIAFIIATLLTLISIAVTSQAISSINYDVNTVEGRIAKPLVEEIAETIVHWGYVFVAIYAGISVTAGIYLYVTKDKLSNEATKGKTGKKSRNKKA